MSVFSKLKSWFRPIPRTDFKIVFPDQTCVWTPQSDMTPCEAAAFALLLHKGANSTRDEWSTLERHLTPVESIGEENDTH